MRIIGDVHGKMQSYLDILASTNQKTLQVGDMGIGFGDYLDDRINREHGKKNAFIRGNHDDPAKCNNTRGYVPDGVMHEGIFCVGGAFSIDHYLRVEGVSWWRDEELSYNDFMRIADYYEQQKPDIVVTHDFPLSAADNMFKTIHRGNISKTTTGQGLDMLFGIHQPKFWIGGHWHQNTVLNVAETTFICVDELEWIDINDGKVTDGSSPLFHEIIG